MADGDDLLAEYRRRADDMADPPHVSDTQVFALLAEAEREACMREAAIFDYTTPAIVQYAIAANQTSVTLDERVLRVDHATFTPTGATAATRLELTGIDHIRDMQADIAPVSGRPVYAAHVMPRGLVLHPAPSVAGTLALDVYRLPMTDIVDGGDEPEIPLAHHYGLIDWVLYRVYSTKDSELEDPERAAIALRDFTERFGQRRSADTQRRHRERRRVTTRNLYP